MRSMERRVPHPGYATVAMLDRPNTRPWAQTGASRRARARHLSNAMVLVLMVLTSGVALLDLYLLATLLPK